MNPKRTMYKFTDGPDNIWLYLFEHEFLGYIRKGIKLTRVS